MSRAIRGPESQNLLESAPHRPSPLPQLAQSREEDGPESETEPYSDMSLEPSQETLSPASATGGPEGAAKPGPRLRADEVARPQGAPANGEGAGGMAVGGRGHDAGPCPRCGEEGREEQRREEREREWGRERARLLKRVEEAERDLER